MGPRGTPMYTNNQDPTSPAICSSSYQCRSVDDIYDGPNGTFGVSFDDGPLPPTTTLVNFLKSNNEIAMHFMIGYNLLIHSQQLMEIFQYGGDCAVHTWSHPYMTTLSNEDVVAELGWTMQIIHDSTGGKVPRMWRPPFGDSDVRVRAIAQQVFGIDTVIWNQDSDDWTLNNGRATMDTVLAALDGFTKAPKSPGLIVLEHESSDGTVKAFVDTYPKIKSNGWQIKSLVQLLGNGDAYYQNVKGNTITPANVYVGSGGGNSAGNATATGSGKPKASSKPTSTGTAMTSKASNSASMSSRSFVDARGLLVLAVAVSAGLVGLL